MTAPLRVVDVLGRHGLLARSDPGFEYREPQLRFAQAVEHAVDLPGGAIVAGELPTGSGKSRGALLAPVLAGRKTLYSTYTKGLQTQLRDRDLPSLERHLGYVLGRGIPVAVLKGRASYVCRRAESDLQGRLAFATPEAHEQWRALEPWLRTTEDGDLDAAPVVPGPELRARLTVDDESCDHRQCPLFERCYVTRARRAAEAPETVVVANHHLVLLDARIRRLTGGEASILPRPGVLILDEGHTLPGVARDVLGEEAHFGYGRTLGLRLGRLADETGADVDVEALALELQETLDAWATTLAPQVRAMERRTGRAEVLLGDERDLADPVAEAAEAVAEACRSEARRLEREAARRALDDDDDTEGPLADAKRWHRQGDNAGRFAGVVRLIASPPETGDPDAFLRRALLEGDEAGRRPRLAARWTPVDVSKALTTLLWDGTLAPVVVTCSATLATAPTGPDRLAYFKGQVGIPASTPERPVLELVEGSPFDWAGRARLYVSSPAVLSADRQRDREAFDRQLATEVTRVLSATGGRALALFTSVQSLAAVAELVAPALPPEWAVFCQGTTPRHEILEAFAVPERPPVVCLATRSWWEGVDIVGLDAVVIDRLPFEPPDDPLHAARVRRAVRLRGDPWAGWEQVTLPSMTLALRQGVGRLLRTRRDRGLVAVLDPRLVTKGYGPKVVAALPPMGRVRSLTEAAAFLRGPP